MLILVEEEGRTQGWVYHHREGDKMKISDMDEVFQQGLRRVKLEKLGMIYEGLEVGEDMGLMRSLGRGSNKEVLNNGMDSSLVE